MICILLVVLENCIKYDTINDFSVWLRTGFNPADINRFQSHTEKYYAVNIDMRK